MWQEVAIILIGVFTVAYVGLKLYRTFTAPKDPNNPCIGCTGCTIKKQMEQAKAKKECLEERGQQKRANARCNDR